MLKSSVNNGRKARAQSSSAAPCSGRGLDKKHYRVVVMGAAAVGKTCIINRFLYERFVTEYKATVEELHQGLYDVDGVDITLNMLDTSGSYEFPAMRELYIATADAFILVYSVDSQQSFQEIQEYRSQILKQKLSTQEPIPIVIVGNKSDLEEEKRQVHRQTAESTVNIDWDNGFVEVSAKDDVNVTGIFRELLAQAKVEAPIVRRRRQSVPSNRKNQYNNCNIS